MRPQRAARVSAASAPLPIGTGWGPTTAEINQARDLVGAMSVPQRAGQVLVASYSGTSPPTVLVKELHLGGIVSFASNITTPNQIRASNQKPPGRPSPAVAYPLLTAVDQEGGRVARLTNGATRFPSLMNAGAARHPTQTQAQYTALAGELADVGFNVDFAPDADVTMGVCRPDDRVTQRRLLARPRRDAVRVRPRPASMPAV